MVDTEAREALAEALRKTYRMKFPTALPADWRSDADFILSALTPAGPEERGEGLRELRALSDAATQGDWRAWGDVEDQWGHPMPRISHGDGTGAVFTIAVVSSWDRREENRDFIVAAVNYVRRALAATPVPDTGAEERLDEAYEAGRLVGYEEGRTVQARVQDASGAEERLRAALERVTALHHESLHSRTVAWRDCDWSICTVAIRALEAPNGS